MNRRLLSLLLALLCAIPTPASQAREPILFGTLQTDAGHAAQEYAGGTRLAMMEIFWDRYQPEQNSFNQAYAAQQKSHLQKLRALGFRVTLGLGAHYPPPWLAREAGSRFINQRGEASRDLNFVFSQAMRSHFERYLQRVDEDLGLENFWAIRITSGGNAELLYPEGGSYWAFDQAAQNGPGRPAGLPLCPFPGWKPGQSSLAPAQVQAWADWYVRCLALAAGWQMQALDALGFGGWFQILTPGSGARPSGYQVAVHRNLPDGIVGVGAVWHKLYELLPDKRRAVVYISSVADRSGQDDATQPGDVKVPLSNPLMDKWSATRWQVRLARQFGMPVAGENPGFGMPSSLSAHYRDRSPSGMLARSMAQAQAGQFQCFYWAHSGRLWDGTKNFLDYAAAIRAANGG